MGVRRTGTPGRSNRPSKSLTESSPAEKRAMFSCELHLVSQWVHHVGGCTRNNRCTHSLRTTRTQDHRLGMAAVPQNHGAKRASE